jgi:hypothetical protein
MKAPGYKIKKIGFFSYLDQVQPLGEILGQNSISIKFGHSRVKYEPFLGAKFHKKSVKILGQKIVK